MLERAGGSAADGHEQMGEGGPLAVVHDVHGGGVGNSEAAGHVVGEVFGDERLIVGEAFGVVDVVGIVAIHKPADGSADRLHLGIGGHEQHVGREGLGDGTGLVHGAVVGQIERGALARERLGALQVEQVGVGIGGEAVVVLAQVVIVAGSGHDEESVHGVLGGAHLLKEGLQVGQPLGAGRGRELHGAQAVLLGSLLHALIDKVVVVAVAHGIRVVDDGDERRSRGHIRRVGLIDDVAVLSARGKCQQHRSQRKEFCGHCSHKHKKKAASLAWMQEKPYINARQAALDNV